MDQIRELRRQRRSNAKRKQQQQKGESQPLHGLADLVHLSSKFTCGSTSIGDVFETECLTLDKFDIPGGNDLAVVLEEEEEEEEGAEAETQEPIPTAQKGDNDKPVLTARTNSADAVENLLKLRKELHQLRRMSTLHREEDSMLKREAEEPASSLPLQKEEEKEEVPPPPPLPLKSKKKKKKTVQFAAPLVTKIKHRPYTDPQDIEKLYFVSEELDEFEYDRETTDGDQFECRLVVPDHKRKEMFRVAVSYKNRPRSAMDPSDDLMLSPSDLSALTD